MAITSKGYEKDINYTDWAAITAHMGGTYSVFGDASVFAASAGSGDRQVRIAPGTAGGAGILDVSDSTVTVAGGVVASGSRWDLIVLRRNWTTKATTIAIVPGGPSKVIPAERAASPGSIDEQPLFLVRFAAGQTAVQDIVDLRVWRGDSGLWANDNLVRSYMNRVGTVIRVGALFSHRILSGGVAVWFEQSNRELIGDSGVKWMIEGSTGKVYLRDETAGTWPWTIERNGTLTQGRVPVERITGVLPMSKGGLGVTTPAEARTALGLGFVSTLNLVPVERGGTGSSSPATALANLGIMFADTPSFTLPNNMSIGYKFAVNGGSAADYTVIPIMTNPLMDVRITRVGTVITFIIENRSGASRTGTLTAVIMRRGLQITLAPDAAPTPL